MDIQIVNADDMKSGRGKGSRGAGKYTKYIVASKKLVPQLKEAIAGSPDGYIRVKTSEFARELGKEFKDKHTTSVYWGTKFALFKDGIIVGTGKHNDGDHVLIMRAGTAEDKLPKSLSKGVEPKEGEENVGEEGAGQDDIGEEENDEESGIAEEDK